MKHNLKNALLLLVMLLPIGLMAQFNMQKSQNVKELDANKTTRKISTLLYYINNFYVDTLDMPGIVETVIVQTLKELDPHSAYIAAEDVKRADEPLRGSFEGVGITFQLFKDTILVVSPIPGGPSDRVGIMAGDKILKVEDEIAYGDDINNQWVMDHLRGKKGTKVKVSIYRRGNTDLIDFEITRDKIPINSMDAAFMLDKETGYIKLNRFSKTSLDEVNKAMISLKKQGLKNLVFDLRGNSGGYLGTAMTISDEFLAKDKLIVYTEGIHSPRQELVSTEAGEFEKGKLIVLINEGSASAAEIVTGAVQDWDRAVVIGRRSFGKGLVQRPFQLPDKSVIRLTIARYYTPSGRCIQKPYDEGVDEYYKDFKHRMEHGELIHPDSINFPDSLKFATKNGRTVYGGGGIMPDIFVPLDSVRFNDLYSQFIRKGAFNRFVNEYLDAHRTDLLAAYNSFDKFNSGFGLSDSEFDEFLDLAEEEKVELNDEDLKPNIEFIKLQLKALIARNLYEAGDYFEVISEMDNEIKTALEVINNKKRYEDLISRN
ncbi:MAG: PDZ domain-containing protein [Chlorobi bacterium]|nr:PDZ domain-containing protein [Chlorobiota bacterium]